MGVTCSSKLKEIENKILVLESKAEKYLTTEHYSVIKNDLKNGMSLALESALPILEEALNKNVNLKQKKEVSELTKSFVMTTLRGYDDKINKIDNKVDYIDKTKINKQNLNILTNRITDVNPLEL
jgi:predicted nucleic acid-binding OB-fold protein